MDIAHGDIVISLNGRDGGKFFYVLAREDDYAHLSDGKIRRLEKPKRKKLKHLRLEHRGNSRTADKIRSGMKVTNSEIRRALAEYAANGSGEKGGM